MHQSCLCRAQPRGFGDKGYDLASFGHRHFYADEDADIDGWLKTGSKNGTKKNKKSSKVWNVIFMDNLFPLKKSL